jgi:hypothetical protein
LLKYFKRIKINHTLKKSKTMKNFRVKVNTERRPFFQAQFQTVGTVHASSKKEAIKLMHDAAWGVDNDAVILTDGQTLAYCTKNASYKAEAE